MELMTYLRNWKTLAFLLLCTYGITLNAKDCNVNKVCNCCAANATCLQIGDKLCRGPCKDGFWGGRCKKVCPAVCVNCSQNFRIENECYACVDGQFGFDCTSSCSNNCKTCTKETGKCMECQSGYYGSECTNTCPDNCKDQRCKKDTGYCYECTDGYTGMTSSGSCSECNSGYFGLLCENCPSGCTNMMCNNTSGFCFLCNSGFYGNTCNKTCSNKCMDYICDMLTGNCGRCTPGFFGDICQHSCGSNCIGSVCNKTTGACSECFNGYHGGFCNKTCSSNCINSSCDRYSGECLFCKIGYFGYQCNKDCSKNCIDGICDKMSGICNACMEGYYGKYCNMSCPVNCETNVCDKVTGECTACADGFYGALCNMSCSVHCKNSICDRETGVCTACTGGFHGPLCDMTCSTNCENQICARETGECTTCVSGFYGGFCKQNCSDYCLNSTCDKAYGTCIECIVGRYGTLCSKDCSSTCYNTICEQSSGLCSYGCVSGFQGVMCEECITGKYGDHCNLNCSNFCNNSTCFSGNGTCTFGCRIGSSDSEYCCTNNTNCYDCSSPSYCKTCIGSKYGETCENDCPTNCNGTCNRDSGNCAACTIDRYGLKCDYTCSDTCLDLQNRSRLCYRNNGTCIHGCIQSYFGDDCQTDCSDFCSGHCERANGHCFKCDNNTHGMFCNISCPLNCHFHDKSNSSCFQSNGSCTNGCEQGYFNDTCELSCSSGCNGSCEQSSGRCIGGCIEGFTGETCRLHETADAAHQNDKQPDSSLVATFIAVSVVVICIGIVITGVVIFVKRRRGESSRKHIYLNTSNKGYAKPSVSHVYENTMFTEHHDTAGIDEDTKLAMSQRRAKTIGEFSNEHYEPNDQRTSAPGHTVWQSLAKQDDVLKDEFMTLLHGLIKSYGDSRKPENISKNRYNMIYPYDEDRVKILDVDSDYINASYINGCNKESAYIAALGPTIKTLGDEFHMFWNMVWQEKVETIVMLTKLVEITGMKCDQYWPNQGTTAQYGHFTVKSNSEEDYTEFVVRNLTVSKTSDRRHIRHVHFTAWPDKGVPSDVISINNLRHKVVNLRKMFSGPLLVHCSAGIGRTGTYIALDILTEKGALRKSIDVFECVNTMRQQRVNMVQTLDQYKYLHHAALWSLTFDIEPISAERFMDLTWLYEGQFLSELLKQLQTEIFFDTDDVQEAIAENKVIPFANRHGSDIPGSRNTVFLFTNDENGFDAATYINAVYIDGYRKQNRFIAAQTPLPETVSSFLDMIRQEKVACIVDLTPDDSQDDVGVYLPVDDQDLQHNKLVFTVVNREDKTAYTKLEVAIYEHEDFVQTIHHFKFNKWVDGESVPESPEKFLELVNDVEKLVNTNELSGPILVHCLTGAVNSGLFCAVWVLLERIGVDYRASVVNTLGQIKARRKMAFQNEDQIAFCFECVAMHLKNLDQHVYSNMVLNN